MAIPVGARLINDEHSKNTHPLDMTEDHSGGMRPVDVAPRGQLPPKRYTANPDAGTVYYLTRDNGRLVVRLVDPDGRTYAFRAPATGSSAALEALIWLSLSATTLSTIVPTVNPAYRHDGSSRVTFSFRKADAAFGFNVREAVTELADDGWLTIAENDETRWTVDLVDDLRSQVWNTLYESSEDPDLTVVDSTGSALLAAYNSGPNND